MIDTTPPSVGQPLSREEWLTRCAKHFVEKACVSEADALSLAGTQLENLNDDLTESPEEAADSELSYWGND